MAPEAAVSVVAAELAVDAAGEPPQAAREAAIAAARARESAFFMLVLPPVK